MAAFPRKDAITRHMAAKASSSLKRKAAAYAGVACSLQRRDPVCLQALLPCSVRRFAAER